MKLIHDWVGSNTIIQDFAFIIAVASAIALISYRLKHPMVNGDIAASTIIDPHAPHLSFTFKDIKSILLVESRI
jgi:hypothetical protein